MKNSTNKLLSITILVVGAIWGLGVFVFAGQKRPPIPYGGALLCGLIAIAAAVVYLMFFRVAPGRQAVEEGSLGIIATVVFVVAVICTDTILIFARSGDLTRYVLLINLAIGAAYLLLILYIEKNTQRLIEQLDRTEQKTFSPVKISGKLGACLGAMPEGEARSRVLKLKEAVDYGSNITTGGTAEFEQQMDTILSELVHLITTHAPDSETLNKIQEAEICWKMRSSAASSGK